MKKLFILSLLSLTILNVNAQCINIPSCTNSITMACDDMSNQSTNSNTCYNGYGSIPTSYNWNNWNWLQFNSTTASINVDQNLNLGYNKKLYNSGYAVSYWGNTSLSGGDTILVGTGCVLTIAHPISNNSNPGQKNVIILQTGARLLVTGSLTEYYAGDTIKTVLGNNSNNIYVVPCSGIPLGNKIIEFSINNNILNWFVEDSDDIQIQYSEDTNHFRTIYYTSQNKGQISIQEAGYYRIKADNVYSKILTYQLNSVKPSNNEYIYYYMGSFYKDPPNVRVYGHKKLK